MSGNAALAAAKRRRNPAGNEIMHGSSGHPGLAQEEQKPRNVPNLQVLVLEHDRRLFVLERDANVKKLETSITSDTSHLDKLVTNNSAELKLLKTNYQKQVKINQELSSQNVLLKASLGAQANEISKMRSLMEEMEVFMKNTANLAPISEENSSDAAASEENASQKDVEEVSAETEQLTLEVTES